jgi:uncharacterized protein (DUF433 family)
MTAVDDIRFTTPLYTLAESARFLGVHPSTFGTWAKGYTRTPPGRKAVTGAPIVTAIADRAGAAAVPFIGLAEGLVVAGFRRSGVSMQHIRSAVDVLRREIGLEHALASRRLYADGASVLYDYAEREQDEELAGLTEVVSRQKVFSPVVADYLTRIEYGEDEWAITLTSPATRGRTVIVDPRRSFGQPIFVHGAARVEDVVDRWRAGESLHDVAADFGVPQADIEDYLRVALPLAA